MRWLDVANDWFYIDCGDAIENLGLQAKRGEELMSSNKSNQLRLEVPNDDKIELIARQRAHAARNEALAVFAFFSILAGLGIWSSLKSHVNNIVSASLEKTGIQELQRRAADAAVKIEKSEQIIDSKKEELIKNLESLPALQSVGKILLSERKDLMLSQESKSIIDQTIQTRKGQTILVFCSYQMSAILPFELSVNCEGSSIIKMTGGASNRFSDLSVWFFVSSGGEQRYSVTGKLDSKSGAGGLRVTTSLTAISLN